MKKKTTEEQLSLAGTEEGKILARLNERVEKAVQLIQDLRRERDALKTKLEKAETELQLRGEADTEELERLRGERSEIRNRIEMILGNLETLDAGE